MERRSRLAYYIVACRQVFFFTFFVDKFLLSARMHATKDASFFWRVWYASDKIARHRMEIDYGDENNEGYDRQDCE